MGSSFTVETKKCMIPKCLVDFFCAGRLRGRCRRRLPKNRSTPAPSATRKLQFTIYTVCGNLQAKCEMTLRSLSAKWPEEFVFEGPSMEEHCLFCNRGMLLWQQADQDTVGVSIGHALSHLGSFINVQST